MMSSSGDLSLVLIDRSTKLVEPCLRFGFSLHACSARAIFLNRGWLYDKSDVVLLAGTQNQWWIVSQVTFTTRLSEES